MSYFEYEQKQVYYTEQGEGPTVVLLHGNTASSAMFQDVIDLYAKQFHVVTLDFLGHGKSSRLTRFPDDLWFYEAQQVIALVKEKQWGPVNLIGSSGGAIVAIHVALEANELVHKVIADSFEGEHAIHEIVLGIQEEREASKKDEQTRLFYEAMHGEDWEMVVDQDSDAIVRHESKYGYFFHSPLNKLSADIRLTGSKGDEFVQALSPNYFETVYPAMLSSIGHGTYYLFQTGGHPAMLSNPESFYEFSKTFFIDEP